jgi:hypothetical protein
MKTLAGVTLAVALSSAAPQVPAIDLPVYGPI